MLLLFCGTTDVAATVRNQHIVGGRQSQRRYMPVYDNVVRSAQSVVPETISPQNIVAQQPVVPDVMSVDMAAADVSQDVVHVSQEVPESEEQLFSDEELDEIISELNAVVSVLTQEIETINMEMARCQKAQRNAKVLSVIGGLGVLGTGIGAAVQGAQIKSAITDDGGDK